jgi:hypothetical protein
MTPQQTNENPSRILMSDFEGPRGSTSETARGQANHDRELATDLDTQHGGTDANKRDAARQLGRLNVAHVQL